MQRTRLPKKEKEQRARESAEVLFHDMAPMPKKKKKTPQIFAPPPPQKKKKKKKVL